ncbi:hypothetical protein BRC86_11690 [Halobacteriales archaeon QS_3_64_16]|nr:MAG: hypothetical protein BRC86_11690 [Halobacteriales archaeon QS_3_64_16]
MLQGNKRYRLLEPGETMRSRREQVGWASTTAGILKQEVLRSIGVFGLLYVPTSLIAVIGPSLDPAAFITYLPAACLTVVTVACIAWLRIETRAGPMPEQLREALGTYRTK